MLNFTSAQTIKRIYSGAPIGNESIHHYPGIRWTGLNLILGSNSSLTSKGAVILDNITGNPEGVHLYRVDAYPNEFNGLNNPLDTYFGTFVVKGISPEYTIKYDYSGTQFENMVCEQHLRLMQRDDNSVTSWSDLPSSVDLVANNVVTEKNIRRKEIILDTSCILPAVFLSFDAHQTNEGNVVLKWKTALEIDHSHYIVEKAIDDKMLFEPISNEIVGSGSGLVNDYTFTDYNNDNRKKYYRIKMVDLDSKFSYTNIKAINPSIDHTLFDFYPNPCSDMLTVKTNNIGTWHISLINLEGKEVLSFNKENVRDEQFIDDFDISFLQPGIYILKFLTNNDLIFRRLEIK